MTYETCLPKVEYANTVDPDEMSHNKLSHLDLQCLPSSL